jgi:hypothetical protein
LLVARHAMTESGALEKSFRLLHARTPGTPIGIVVNAVKRPKDSYYQAYGSYGYGSGKHLKGQALHV